jgi:hypothetical protein
LLRRFSAAQAYSITDICGGVGMTTMCGLAIGSSRKSEIHFIGILLIFRRPALINSATGLGNVLLTIYTTKVDVSSTIQKVGIAMAASCTGVMLALFLFYHNLLLARVRSDREAMRPHLQTNSGTMITSQHAANILRARLHC